MASNLQFFDDFDLDWVRKVSTTRRYFFHYTRACVYVDILKVGSLKVPLEMVFMQIFVFFRSILIVHGLSL